MPSLQEKAATHIKETIDHALLHTQNTLVIYDEDSELSKLITAGYRGAVPNGKFLLFSEQTKESLMEEFDALQAGDLVVQVQSSSFRLDDFRIRIHLFKLGLKAVEHMHLQRLPESQYETYIDTLHYDPEYYHTIGYGVRSKLEKATSCEVLCQGTRLYVQSAFEEPKINIGDYRELPNTGGMFPIGEVFTEPKDLQTINGEVKIYAFAGMDHKVNSYEPFKATIIDGILSAGDDAPQAFHEILDLIRETEPVTVREFGFGMNPAMYKGRMLDDMGACERITGLHLSLGGKHDIFKKEGFKKKKTRYHIDVLIDAEKISLDGEVLYQGGKYSV